MNSIPKITVIEDRKGKLSVLWMVVMLNMLYADILSFMFSDFLKEIMAGHAGQVPITQGSMLIAAIVVEIPIIMVLLSRVLKYRANRRANIVADMITIAFVIGGGSTILHYLFLATIEVVCLSLIIWYAWTWRDSEGQT